MALCEADLAATLKGLEEELLRPQVRKDKARLLELLAEEFREFGSSGRVFNRDQMVETLAVEKMAEIVLDGVVAERIGNGCVLVTYRAHRCNDGRIVQESLRSSIWIERNERWQILFHQGTQVGGQ